jgi:hypothetical protein
MRATTFALAALSLSLAACGRAHLSAEFGRASRRAFELQQAAPAKPAPPPSMALDTQEADVIARSYVRSLSGKTETAEPEPVVYFSTQRQARPVPLVPSVPKE